MGNCKRIERKRRVTGNLVVNGINNRESADIPQIKTFNAKNLSAGYKASLSWTLYLA